MSLSRGISLNSVTDIYLGYVKLKLLKFETKDFRWYK